ncbi:MAG: nitroreductase family protein [Bacteroidia bacterium]|nr:nitroreductase family protein [Bacteroidia bacterium]
MELSEVIKQRASIRVFTDEKVVIADLKEMVRRAGMAPSVNNYQPWKFIAITNSHLLHRMASEVAHKISTLPNSDIKRAGLVKSQVEWFATFFENAPAVIALAMESYETVLEKGVSISHEEINRMRNYPDIQSAGAAIQNILLTAVDLGYGACWLSAPLVAKNELESLLNITSPWKLIAFVAVGKPKISQKPSNRKNLDDIFELME